MSVLVIKLFGTCKFFVVFLNVQYLLYISSLKADQGEFLKEKIRQLIPDLPNGDNGLRPRGQGSIEKIRSNLYSNIWAQSKLIDIKLVVYTYLHSMSNNRKIYQWHIIVRYILCCCHERRRVQPSFSFERFLFPSSISHTKM